MSTNCLGTVGSERCAGKHPIVQIEDLGCERPQGGDKTVGIPEYKLSVTNPPEDSEQEE